MSIVSSLFEPLQTWLHQLRRSIAARFSTQQQEISEPDDSLLQLPAPLRQKLSQQLKQLPSHPSHLEQLQEDFNHTFNDWYADSQKQPNSDDWETSGHNNVWIIVSPSVANLSDVINVFLDTVADPDSDPDSESDGETTYKGLKLHLTQWPTRPDVKSLPKVLQQQFGRKIASEHGREIVVIPCLEHCFLRSVDGLESIDHLRKYILSDASRFWILGLGQVSWKYLQTICALDAYSHQITHLNKLSGQQLSTWVDPIVAKLNIDFPASSLKSKLANQKLSHREKYFKTLAQESDGIDTVAIQLFLNTLQVLDDEQEDCQENQTAEQTNKGSDSFQHCKIQAKSPKNPSLPELDGEDIYLLYSLLLHRTLTKKELAESLGLTPHQIEHSVQTLCNAGVIEQQASVLRLNPTYYPTVCTKLAGDNFSL